MVLSVCWFCTALEASCAHALVTNVALKWYSDDGIQMADSEEHDVAQCHSIAPHTITKQRSC